MAAKGKAPQVKPPRKNAELEAELQRRTAERDEALARRSLHPDFAPARDRRDRPVRWTLPRRQRRIDRAFALDMGIFRLKFTMNFLMNLCSHLQIVSALLIGGWWVYTDRLAIGGVVAFISGIGRLNDPWGDLVNYFRDISVNQVKYGLLANAIDELAREQHHVPRTSVRRAPPEAIEAALT